MASKVENYPIAEEAFNLKTFLDKIVEKVRDVYNMYNVPLPDRQYWTFGDAAFDCEQMVVSFVNLYLGPPGDEASQPQRCSAPRTAVVTINVVRKTATPVNGKLPSATSLQDAADWQAIDAWILIESNQLFDQWDDFIQGPGVIATVTAGTASGGFQNVSMQLTMAVP